MKIDSRILILLFLAVVSPVALAQIGPSVGQALDVWIANTEKEVVAAADAMPEEKYAFAPTAGEFTGVRTFAEQVKHLSAANYQLAARILDENPSHGEHNETAPDSIKGKAQIMEYVRGSFAALHRAVVTISETNMLDPLGSRGPRNRLESAVDAVAHSYDHYGQMVEYLRMNGIVPPASRK
jgi:uncharacterized damage-inducible protein DinB